MAFLATACSSSPAAATFSLSNAKVDASYSCPKGANNAPYDIHGTVQVHNPTARSVTVEAVRVDLTLDAVKGAWLQKIGDTYQVGSASFGPGIVKAGSDLAMNVTIPSACTSGKTPSGSASYGDYLVRLHVVTTEGIFSIAANPLHRIAAA